jgi:4,4'-diaponeurosporenoate glycosyltransferase
MFPEGFAQHYESWTKAFADGAGGTDVIVLALAILWLASMSSILIFLVVGGATLFPYAALCYLIFASQMFFFARQIGSYRLFTSLAYPVPLLFFFALFGGALVRKQRKEKSAWRGRQV